MVPVVTTDKDMKPKPKQIVVKLPEDEDGRLNDAFEKADDRRFDAAKSQPGTSDSRGDRDNRESRGDQDPREYAQNFENGRAVSLRDSQRHRGAEAQQTSAYDPEHRRIEDSRIMYKSQDIYQRPVDELDTPRFPTEFEKRESTFAKIVNPSVKIMKVERDVEEALDSYR